MKTLLLLFIASARSVLSFSQDPPKQMTKVVVQLQGPEIPAESFAPKPKTMYRAGGRYCRMEEEPDTKNGIHGLAVTNEPDFWMTNLMTKTARHGVDPGPHIQLPPAAVRGRSRQGSSRLGVRARDGMVSE